MVNPSAVRPLTKDSADGTRHLLQPRVSTREGGDRFGALARPELRSRMLRRHSRLQDRRRPAGPRVSPASPCPATGAIGADPAAPSVRVPIGNRRRHRRAAAAKRDARRRLHSSDRLRELQRAVAPARRRHQRDGDLLPADRAVLVSRTDRRVRLQLVPRARDRHPRDGRKPPPGI